MKEDASRLGYGGKWYLHPLLRNAILSGILTGISFGLAHLNLIAPKIELILYLMAILLGGYHWAREGIEEVFEKKRVGIEILMLGATIGSSVLGMWDEAAFLAFLYGTAEGIEEYTYARTRHSIRKLLDLTPRQALLIQEGKEILIPAQQLKIGDLFLVKPGETIATDGIIVEGFSSVNEAPITGESMPVEKKKGMRVFAATFNQEGALVIRTTASFENNTLSKVIHLVEEAQEQKGKAQLFIEKFGNIYSPIVLLGAVVLLVIPYTLGWNFSEWATRAIVLLVAAAPCALVMSTPIAIAAGIGKAGRCGILVKGGAHLENLGGLRVVAFDKTGTLTSGKPVVTDLVPLQSDEKELLSLAFSLEKFSQHPLAQAIVSKAQSMEIEAAEVSDFASMTGSGVRAKLSGRFLYAAKPEFFSEQGYDLPSLKIDRLQEQGKTVIMVATEISLLGLVGIRDEIRPNAAKTIQTLHRMGIKTAMLTGDNERTARVIGKELGFDDVRAGLKPQDKIGAIVELEKRYGAAAMIGDGVNDAPALARATVGIAMGTAGSDAAIEAADVALMADDLNKVVEAIWLGKKARKIGLQNIVFSLLILSVLIPSALAGILSVALAVFAHELSEILAVLNGLRMAKKDPIS